MNLLFASDGQGIGASASVFPVYIQDSFPLDLTALAEATEAGSHLLLQWLLEAREK